MLDSHPQVEANGELLLPWFRFHECLRGKGRKVEPTFMELKKSFKEIFTRHVRPSFARIDGKRAGGCYQSMISAKKKNKAIGSGESCYTSLSNISKHDLLTVNSTCAFGFKFFPMTQGCSQLERARALGAWLAQYNIKVIVLHREDFVARLVSGKLHSMT